MRFSEFDARRLCGWLKGTTTTISMPTMATTIRHMVAHGGKWWKEGSELKRKRVTSKEYLRQKVINCVHNHWNGNHSVARSYRAHRTIHHFKSLSSPLSMDVFRSNEVSSIWICAVHFLFGWLLFYSIMCSVFSMCCHSTILFTLLCHPLENKHTVTWCE